MRIPASYSLDEHIHEEIRKKRLELDVTKSEAVNRVLEFGFKYGQYEQILEHFEKIRLKSDMNIKELTKKIIE